VDELEAVPNGHDPDSMLVRDAKTKRLVLVCSRDVARRLTEHAALLAEREQLRAALQPLARVVPWLPEGKDDDVYLGTQLRGVDNDVTPTLGECRRAAELLAVGS